MKQLKLLILKGIPGSGKSTWARDFIKNNSEKWVIVNRDSIRSMLGNYWVPSREKLVTEIEMSNMTNALNKGYNVILDSTNLNDTTSRRTNDIIKDFLIDKDIEIEIQYKEFNTPLWKCVLRDIKRGLLGGNYVGYKVIKRFHYKYYGNNSK